MSIFGNKTQVNFSVEKIRELLPHRYPFLLIDKVIELETDTSEPRIVAIKNVTINEPFFQGHFPAKPVMPGVLIIEAMAQAAGICALEFDKTLQGAKYVYFISIENAKFRVPVIPGDVLRIEAKLSKARSSICRFDCLAYVEGKLVTEATVTAKVML